MKKLTNLFFGIILLAFIGNAQAMLVLSGDSNIGNALDGSSGAAINAGNQQWFSNILGSGTNVRIQDESSVSASINNSTNAINNYYSGLNGVSSSLFSGTITDSALSGVDMLISILPSNDYTASETAALETFLGAGGTLFLMGDNNSFFANQNNRINSLLAGLGSSMGLGNDSLDGGFNTTTNIDADPLNTGVSSFTYASTNSVVNGGTSLISSLDGTTFIAYEDLSTSVPEPSTITLLGLGLAGIGFARKRINAKAA